MIKHTDLLISTTTRVCEGCEQDIEAKTHYVTLDDYPFHPSCAVATGETAAFPFDADAAIHLALEILVCADRAALLADNDRQAINTLDIAISCAINASHRTNPRGPTHRGRAETISQMGRDLSDLIVKMREDLDGVMAQHAEEAEPHDVC